MGSDISARAMCVGPIHGDVPDFQLRETPLDREKPVDVPGVSGYYFSSCYSELGRNSGVGPIRAPPTKISRSGTNTAPLFPCARQITSLNFARQNYFNEHAFLYEFYLPK